MKKENVLNYFKKVSAIAKATGVTSSAVSQWGNVVPERIALLLDKVTNGALKYDPSLYGDSHASEPKHTDGVDHA